MKHHFKPDGKPHGYIDASKDLTEQDMVRQRYYQLLSEQMAWNLTKPKAKKKLFNWI